MSLGESLRNFVPDSKTAFESLKKAFITLVAKTVLNIRSNPNDAREKSWLLLEDPAYLRDIELWMQEISFSFRISLCSPDGESSHTLLERVTISCAFRDGDKKLQSFSHAEQQAVLVQWERTHTKMLISVPVHTFLKELRYDLCYGGSVSKTLSPRGHSALSLSAGRTDFDFQVQHVREQLVTPIGTFAVELHTREDTSGLGHKHGLKSGAAKLAFEPSRSKAAASCCCAPPPHMSTLLRAGGPLLSTSAGNRSAPAAPMPIRVHALPGGRVGVSFHGVSMPIPGSPPPQAFSLHRSDGASGGAGASSAAGGGTSGSIEAFAGSFEESLLSGHAGGATYSVVRGFLADIGVSARGNEADEKLRMPPHVRVLFDGVFYHFDQCTPYVGTIPLAEKGYRVPARGLLQVTIFNPAKTPLKTFLVNYDLSEMPPEHKTFLRQKITLNGKLVYALHLRFSCPRERHFYLCKKVKVIFPNRVPDDLDQLRVAYDVPKDPPYFPY